MPGSQFVGAVPNPYRYPLPEKGPRPSNEVRCADFVAGVRTGGSGRSQSGRCTIRRAHGRAPSASFMSAIPILKRRETNNDLRPVTG